MRNRRRALEGLEDDIRDHIERETRENIERGMSPDAAREAAIRKFGNVARVMEQTREVWSWVWLEQLLQDGRYAFRFIGRNPRFSATVLLTLALGIGMNTAVFSVVNTVLLRPLLYPNPSRLVWVSEYDPHLHHDVIFGPDFIALRQHAQSYSSMAAYGYNQAAIGTARGVTQVSGVQVAGDFWKLTGAHVAAGRLCGEEEQDCVVFSWDLFERQVAGDTALVGKAVMMNGRPATLAGVLSPAFRFQFPMWWTETRPDPVEAYWPTPSKTLRQTGCQAVALLKPGVSIERAEAELDSLKKHLREGQDADAERMRLVPLLQMLTGAGRQALLLLLAAGAFVLLIACVNIASLLLARATVRQREVAIRAAVGAGRLRVIRQLLAESVLQALAGGVVGLLFARWAVGLLVRISPYALPRLAETTIDGRVLAFTLLVSILTGLLFGAPPALTLWRANLHDALKSGSRTSAGIAGLRARRLLVALELALAIVLLTGAGLMVKSFIRMNAHPPGFTPESVIVMRARLVGPQYAARPVQRAYMDRILQTLRGAPGVRSAGLSNWYLWGGVPAFPADTDPKQTHVLRINAVSPAYLETLGITLTRGRWLREGETSSALINEALAREAFGQMDPLGRQLPGQPYPIVGIVADVRYSKLDAAPPAELYLPYQQAAFLSAMDIAIRVAGRPQSMIPILRKRIADIDSLQPLYHVKTLDQALADSIAPRRFNLFLFAAFAGAALLMALVGIYGVIAYSVAERTREIGLRMALGARRGEVAAMVVREGMVVAIGGILAGVAAASALSRLMTALLYDVQASDPAVFTAVAGLLGLTALAACAAPAFRAASIDPAISLRYE